MDEPLKSYIRAQRWTRIAIGAALVVSLSAMGANALVACSSTPAPAVAKAETDLCKARSAWLLAVAVDPSLAPAPGSLRARLEAAEDAFCKAHPEADAGTP